MIGYGEAVSSQKGWRIYLPASKRVITTTDVTFARDLPSSIRSRDPSLVSVAPPVFVDRTNHKLTAEAGELPASLQLPPLVPSASAAPDIPAPGVSATPPAPPVTPAVPARIDVAGPAGVAPTAGARRRVTPIIATRQFLTPCARRSALLLSVARAGVPLRILVGTLSVVRTFRCSCPCRFRTTIACGVLSRIRLHSRSLLRLIARP